MASKIPTYTAKGTKGTSTLPGHLVAPLNKNLLAQALYVYEHKSHKGSKKTKTRGEIALTKSKWYRQKGTGNARHGAKSAPIFRGGSKAHGPKLEKRTLTLSKKMRKKALQIALGQKAEDNKLIIVKGVNTLKKTSNAAKLIKKILKDTNSKKATLSLSEENKEIAKFFKNISSLKIQNFKDLNARSVLMGGVIIIDENALKSNKTTKS